MTNDELLEIQRAKMDLESRRAELDDTLDELEGKVEQSARMASDWVEMANRPIDYVRRNPIPTAVAAGLLGIAIGSFIAARESRARPKADDLGTPPLDRMGREIGIA